LPLQIDAEAGAASTAFSEAFGTVAALQHMQASHSYYTQLARSTALRWNTTAATSFASDAVVLAAAGDVVTATARVQSQT